MEKEWTKSQSNAIHADGCNILVSAAAGSGKTAVLVERIIQKITDSDKPVSIDRLVVVTFTKAAAAEMKSRIRVELDKLIALNPSDQNLIRQQTLVNNARITTIDSFCLDIVRNYFTETDIDPGFRTADEGEITLINNDIMSQMMEDYYTEGSSEFFNLVDSYGTGRNDSKLERMILRIYEFARSYPWENEWYDSCANMYNVENEEDFENNPWVEYIYNKIKKILSGYRDRYEIYLTLCNEKNGLEKYYERIRQEKEHLVRILESGSFKELSDRVRSFSFDRMPPCSKNCDEIKKAEVTEGRNSLKDFIKSLQTDIFAQDVSDIIDSLKESAPVVRLLTSMARDFSERIKAEKRERNIIDFNDMEHLALDILVHNNNGVLEYTSVADSLSDYYSEILIDEYQDSNMLQEQILTAVSRTRRENEANNIYMVGDVKQSIYRFRMACPELFVEKSNNYKDYTDNNSSNDYCKIQLQNNFRSRDNILNSVNSIFEKIMIREFGGIAYDEDARLNHGINYDKAPDYIIDGENTYEAVDFSKDSSTSIHILEKDDSQDSREEAEARVIAGIIHNLMDRSEGKVYVVADKESPKGYRTIRYSDIVIISRSAKNYAQTVVNTLMDEGIPAYTDSSTGFFAVREIQLVLSFLSVIDNPLNDIPMAAVMMSYYGEMNTKEMADIRLVDKKAKLYDIIRKFSRGDYEASGINENSGVNKTPQLDEKISDKCVKLYNLVEEFRKKSDVMSVYDLLWDVLYSTGYYYYVGTMPSGTRRQANLDILLKKAEDFEKTSFRGLFNFLRYIEKLQTYEVEIGEASIVSEKENVVRLMTIHKSKGLEFPVVIVAGMGKKLNNNDGKEGVLIHQKYGIGMDMVHIDTRTKNPTFSKNVIASALKEDNISEDMRILYVAMTRAREKLIMTGVVDNIETSMKKWEKFRTSVLDGGTYSYLDIDSSASFFDMTVPVAMSDNDNFEIVSEEALEQKNIINMPEGQEGRHIEAEIPPYPHDAEENVKSKVTVSELKHQLHDEDFDDRDSLEDSVKDAMEKASVQEDNEIIPEFMKDTGEKLTGNQRGSAYHRVMECLDYKEIDYNNLSISISEQLQRMLSSKKLTKQQYECIEESDIEKFISSDVGRRIAVAAGENRIWREQPFVFIDRDNPVQLIQGIIDMYFVEDGQIVLLDYKTDKVPYKGGADILKERYSIQLDYYGKALSQITGLPVKEKIIYSFTLGKEILL